MNSTQAYKKFLIKTQENSTNDFAPVSRGRFVELMNEAYVKYMEYIYEKGNSEEIRYIQGLLVNNQKLEHKPGKLNYQLFKLPEDFFNHSSIYCVASHGGCSRVPITTHEIKDANKEVLLSDESTKPSFKYRETLYDYIDNKIRIYTDGFKVDDLYLTYYRYPRKLTLKDPENPESQLDDSFELDLDDKAINRIISLAAKEFDINESNDRFKVNHLRTQSKI